MRLLKSYTAAILSIVLSPNLDGQELNKEQQLFLADQVKTICADKNTSTCDWSGLSGLLPGKNIVMIGEPNHGSKEIFLMRNDLIRQLHDKLDFDVVFFESGIGELVLIEADNKDMTPEQMSYGFFGGWRTREFRDLMEYIRAEKIGLAGFDVQRTGNTFKNLLKQATGYMDTSFVLELENKYGLIQRDLTNRNAQYDSLKTKTLGLIADYKIVHDQVKGKEGNSKRNLYILRTWVNRMSFLQYMLQFVLDKDWHKRWAARDSMMADNIRWLSENMYNNKKLIIVAHNFHIAKYNETEKVMGSMLGQYLTKNIYTIGVFAGEGVYADNSGKETKMSAPDSLRLDIKHIISRLPGLVNFLHMPVQSTKGANWLHNKIVVKDSFIDLNGSDSMILSKHFDGLLFVRSSSMPEK